ncbi:dCTP pyrophosphatase 1-like [Antedon mediterranea]|uniref:dCTP pyrophosphatase 1-like n=1 Tax=Antedon mediterranea TaxID=105859 RepID=UPI003AF9C75D
MMATNSTECTESTVLEKNQNEANIHQDNDDFQFSKRTTLDDIRHLQNTFAKERNWDQFHQPRNLLLAMVGEVGEVSEIFQWKGEVKEGLPGWSEKDKKHLGQELSDVLIYLVRLAEKCHIDLPKAALEKIDLNKLKYPVEKVYGSNKKYTEYK